MCVNSDGVFTLINTVVKQYSIRDVRTPHPGEIVLNTMRYKSSETVHRSGYFQSSVRLSVI